MISGCRLTSIGIATPRDAIDRVACAAFNGAHCEAGVQASRLMPVDRSAHWFAKTDGMDPARLRETQRAAAQRAKAEFVTRRRKA